MSKRMLHSVENNIYVVHVTLIPFLGMFKPLLPFESG